MAARTKSVFSSPKKWSLVLFIFGSLLATGNGNAAMTTADGFPCYIEYHPATADGGWAQGKLVVQVSGSDDYADPCSSKVASKVELEFVSPGTMNLVPNTLNLHWAYSNSELQSLQDRLFTAYNEKKKVRFYYDDAIQGQLSASSRQGFYITLGVPDTK